MRRTSVFRLGTLPISAQIDLRVPTALAAVSALALLAAIINLGIGEFPITPGEVWQTLIGRGTQEHHFIVNVLRLPRTLTAFLVGGALAMSGAILQGVTRNPLSSPDVLGINGGASLLAVTVTVFWPSAPLYFLPAGALGGAALAALVTYVVAWKRGSSPIRLILVGIGVAALTQALVTMVLIEGQQHLVARAMVWMSGSVYGRGWEHIRLLAPWLAVCLVASLALARHLNVLNLGDDVARGLGSPVEWHRGALIGTSVALAAVAVAVAGPVGFVGLMAPHMARQLVGPSHGGLLPVSAMLGGLIVLASDVAGRTLFAPIEIPCGVITAIAGVPYFIYLLYRTSYS